MFSLLAFLFIVVPALEIYLLFSIGGEIGGLNTFMIVIATGIIGAALAKSQGITILQKMQTEMQKGGLPTNQLIQGLMVFAGGLLLLTPGFLTDIVGFSLVAPGPRHILMVWVKKGLANAAKNGNFQFQSFGNMGKGGSGFYYSSTSFRDTTSEENPFVRAEHNSHQTIEGDIIEADFKRKDD